MIIYLVLILPFLSSRQPLDLWSLATIGTQEILHSSLFTLHSSLFTPNGFPVSMMFATPI